MALKFHPVTLPISIVLASLYFFYVTQRKGPNSAKGRDSKDIDVVVHQKAPSCVLRAKTGDILHVHYSGYSKSSGKLFESSREASEPYVFKLGTCNEQGKPECLKGFEKGVAGMCVGEKRKVTLPPKLAFGEVGKEPHVAPNDPVLFHVELIDLDASK
uniref:peptidylprolyl isomerase n=1 Tax=Zooxanthella nutricula TaxID=1333877 RepID=A0A6U6IIF7_9DINO|mmetsp:Transcript_18125/g.54148  ORF Transcript_18125/g.54148 Transcript_18125/m.54148 type:complete len:158 (+) Transcript_18125:3-476(+)